MRTLNLALLALLTLFACSPEKGAPPVACADLCAKYEECGHRNAEGCMESCALEVDYHAYPGEACSALLNEQRACEMALSCEELTADEVPCEAELDALVSDACTTELCDDYADRLIECNYADPDWKIARAHECTMAMAEAHVEVSEACGLATEEHLACGIAQTCEDLQSVQGCGPELAAEEEACE